MSSASQNQSTPKPRPTLGRGLLVAALIGYAIWVIFPMLWVAYSSLKADTAIFRDAFALPPLDDLHTENYGRAWREARFGEYFLNSVVVTTASVVLIVGLGALAAYALARFYHPAGKTVFWLFLAGLTIPAQLAIVPLFRDADVGTAELAAWPDPGLHGQRAAVRDLHPDGVLPLPSARAV